MSLQLAAPIFCMVFLAEAFAFGVPLLHNAYDNSTWRQSVYAFAVLAKSLAEKTLLFTIVLSKAPKAIGDMLLFSLEVGTSLQVRLLLLKYPDDGSILAASVLTSLYEFSLRIFLLKRLRRRGELIKQQVLCAFCRELSASAESPRGSRAERQGGDFPPRCAHPPRQMLPPPAPPMG